MLWFQTRHSKSSFLFPFLSRGWVLSRHIIGSAWFLFHSRALSKVQTDIYIVSFIPHLARPSFQRPPSPPSPPTCEISALCQADSDCRPIQESPPGLVRRGRKDKKNTIDCLYFIRALQHWFNISEVFFTIALSLYSCFSPFLAFSSWLFSSITTTAECGRF